MVVLKEVWSNLKHCGVYNNYYAVSNTGKIKSLRQNKILKPWMAGGYKVVSLYDGNGKKTKQYVHRLVCMTYKGLSKNNYVNHIDGVKTNNNANNLEWVTSKRNAQHAIEIGLKKIGDNLSYTKLSNKQVDCIRRAHKLNKITQDEIAYIFQTSQSHVSAIIKNKRRKNA